MTRFEMTERLMAGQSVGAELLAAARYPAQLAAAEFASRAPEAIEVLDLVGESALAVLAGTGAEGEVAREIWKVRFLAEEMGNVKRDAVRALLPLLSTRDGLPEGMRVCDVAYVIVCWNLRATAAANYMSLAVRERDLAIQELRENGLLEEALR